MQFLPYSTNLVCTPASACGLVENCGRIVLGGLDRRPVYGLFGGLLRNISPCGTI
jgi:hypothetical protein